MSGGEHLAAEIEVLLRLDLEGLREAWRARWGPPPKLRSAEILRLMLAWRIQAEAAGGLDREARRKLARSGRAQAEGLELGVGAILRREWKGETVEVVVEPGGFRCRGDLHPSLSAAATAIAGTRWNGPRFFGLNFDHQRREEVVAILSRQNQHSGLRQSSPGEELRRRDAVPTRKLGNRQFSPIAPSRQPPLHFRRPRSPAGRTRDNLQPAKSAMIVSVKTTRTFVSISQRANSMSVLAASQIINERDR